jgi:hypothetical protein
LFGANGTGAVLRTPDGAEEDGVGGFGRGEGFVGEGLAVGVYRALVSEEAWSICCGLNRGDNGDSCEMVRILKRSRWTMICIERYEPSPGEVRIELSESFSLFQR